jgi:hypothetical protein
MALKKPKLIGKIKKENDLETHIRALWVGGVEFVELRDYIPSTKTYSRGVVFERRLIGDLLDVLAHAE